MNPTTLTPLEKLTKARIHLQDTHPFWGYLTLGLRFREYPEQLRNNPTIPQTAGVDAYGHLYYCPEFVESLSLSDTKALVAHEVSHVAYSHLLRLGTRNLKVWNVATDFVVNDILLQNGFNKMAIMLYDPKFSNQSAEEVYEQLLKDLPPDLPPFDTHIYTPIEGDTQGSGEEQQLSPSNIKSLERQWKRKLVEAYEHSKRAGTAPQGVGRLIDNLLQSKVSWRTLLNRYVINQIPFDWTYRKPSKISRVLKTVYLPSTLNESMDIIVGIDTSCSIGEKELALFKGDMLNISNSFNQVNMHVITCDAEVHDDFTLTNGTRAQFEKLELHGGGGTDLRKIFDRVEKKGMSTSRNVLIVFTDGYTPFPDSKPPINTIWVSTESAKKDYPSWGKFIKVEPQ